MNSNNIYLNEMLTMGLDNQSFSAQNNTIGVAIFDKLYLGGSVLL